MLTGKCSVQSQVKSVLMLNKNLEVRPPLLLCFSQFIFECMALQKCRFLDTDFIFFSTCLFISAWELSKMGKHLEVPF